MNYAIIWLAASAAFAFGWALRPAGPMQTRDHDTRRIVLDWGMAHRLLDQLQVGVEHDDLAPRVRLLCQYLAATIGWPAGVPGPDRFAPRTWPPDPVDDDDLPTPPFHVG